MKALKLRTFITAVALYIFQDQYTVGYTALFFLNNLGHFC